MNIKAPARKGIEQIATIIDNTSILYSISKNQDPN
tara:strand:+ start:1024 stop:1128 length:105 start_codon:yes stop_codon:yes gene_type:complete